ncbi:5-methylcytosine-specific restriction endonuclease McrA [Peribacillus frigoritolerans]
MPRLKTITKFCSCGNVIDEGKTCPCKTNVGTPKSRIPDPSKTDEFRKLSEEIKKRDGGHCQRCKLKLGLYIFNNLKCHHIRSFYHFPELAYEPSNLITVCDRCVRELGASNKLDFEQVVKKADHPYFL